MAWLALTLNDWTGFATAVRPSMTTRAIAPRMTKAKRRIVVPPPSTKQDVCECPAGPSSRVGTLLGGRYGGHSPISHALVRPQTTLDRTEPHQGGASRLHGCPDHGSAASS